MRWVVPAIGALIALLVFSFLGQSLLGFGRPYTSLQPNRANGSLIATISLNGKYVAVGMESGQVLVAELPKNADRKAWRNLAFEAMGNQDHQIRSLIFSPDSQSLASSDGEKIVMRSMANRRERWRDMPTAWSSPWSISFTADGKELLARGDYESWRWPLDGGYPKQEFYFNGRQGQSYGYRAFAFAVSSLGDAFEYAGDGAARVMIGSLSQTLKVKGGSQSQYDQAGPQAIAWAPNGKAAVCLTSYWEVGMPNVTDLWPELHQWDAEQAIPAFAGNRQVVIGWGNQLRWFEPTLIDAEGKAAPPIRRLQLAPGEGKITSVASDKRGQVLVVGTSTGHLILVPLE